MAGQILMVLATQSHNIRAFFKTNEEPLLRLGLGTLSCYLGLLALSKSYEAKKLSDELAGQAIHFRATKEALTDEKWLQKASALVLQAAQTSSTGDGRSNGYGTRIGLVTLDTESVRVSTTEALRKEIESAFVTGERRGVQEARAREWMPELSLPRTDAVKEARERRDALLTSSSTKQQSLEEERRADSGANNENSASKQSNLRPVENTTATASIPVNIKRSGLI